MKDVTKELFARVSSFGSPFVSIRERGGGIRWLFIGDHMFSCNFIIRLPEGIYSTAFNTQIELSIGPNNQSY